MKLSQMYRTALIATMLLILSSGLDMRGFAQANSPQGAKNIVLVHGAWADGSCWSKVIALLEAKGFHVVAVQNPLTSLADDVAATKRIIALQDGPVILVGHSYAGVVITEAGNDPKVVGLVYVAAFAPGEGESINSVSKPYPPAPLGSELRLDAQGFLTATPKRNCRRHGAGSPGQGAADTHSDTGSNGGSCFRSHSHDSCVEEQAFMGRDRRQRPGDSAGARERRSSGHKGNFNHPAANHLAMLSHPREVAELIEQAAAKAK